MGTMMASRKKAATVAVAEVVEFTPDALAIRTCGPEGISYNGFKWPMGVGAVVECPDWDAVAECGHGLHGLLDGVGDWGLTYRDNAVWQVVGVMRSECVAIDDDKVKFPRCRVEYVGGFAEAMKMVQQSTVKRLLELAKGNMATGDSGHAAATGYRGHAAATGYRGHAAATGYRGHAAATGKSSIAASLGLNGTAEGALGSYLVLAHYDTDVYPYVLTRVERFKVGEDGVEPNKAYRLGADGKPVAA